MTSLLSDDLAQEITEALEAEGVAYDVTVTRVETTGGDPWNPTTEAVDYEGRGWRDSYRQDVIDGSLIQANDVRVMIIASSLSIHPTTADTIKLDGKSFSIVSVKRDPAGALWDVQGRA